jgi:hypothetical protein
VILDRLAHRLRDIQKLPYVVVANPHFSLVYELYYKAFERFRTVPEIRTLDDNDRFCDILRKTLREHLVVIPRLAMGVLECRGLLPADAMDQFMNTLLRAVRHHSLGQEIKSNRRGTSENLPSSDCGATPGANRNLQLAMALPWIAGPDRPECRLCRRSFLEVQRQRGRRAMRQASTRHDPTDLGIR